jgi:hypothetical protein
MEPNVAVSTTQNQGLDAQVTRISAASMPVKNEHETAGSEKENSIGLARQAIAKQQTGADTVPKYRIRLCSIKHLSLSTAAPFSIETVHQNLPNLSFKTIYNTSV